MVLVGIVLLSGMSLAGFKIWLNRRKELEKQEIPSEYDEKNQSLSRGKQ